MDGCATDRSSYSETSGRAECEAAVPAAAAPSVGQVLALAGSAGTDWRVSFRLAEHVFVMNCPQDHFSMFASVFWKCTLE